MKMDTMKNMLSQLLKVINLKGKKELIFLNYQNMNVLIVKEMLKHYLQFIRMIKKELKFIKLNAAILTNHVL